MLNFSLRRTTTASLLMPPSQNLSRVFLHVIGASTEPRHGITNNVARVAGTNHMCSRDTTVLTTKTTNRYNSIDTTATLARGAVVSFTGSRQASCSLSFERHTNSKSWSWAWRIRGWTWTKQRAQAAGCQPSASPPAVRQIVPLQADLQFFIVVPRIALRPSSLPAIYIWVAEMCSHMPIWVALDQEIKQGACNSVDA